MNILVLGGTRYFGIHLVEELLQKGHHVTIATRGITKDSFGSNVDRIILDRTNSESLNNNLKNMKFDIVYDNLSYSSNEVKFLLDVVKTKRYIMTSTMSVYNDFHNNMRESEFNPLNHTLTWCSRQDFTYDEIKRQAESALFQVYPEIPAVAVRFPWVIGIDDYTKRLHFYVEHVVKGIPMNIDNLNSSLTFINSNEAGEFLSWLATQDFVGVINGCSFGGITIRQILNYIEERTSKQAVIYREADSAPYNGAPSFSISTEKAASIGFRFSNLEDWFFELLDSLIAVVEK